MMRAKMFVESVTKITGGNEVVKFRCVSDTKYGPNGENEDNTFAKWSPSGELSITIANPDLHGKLKPDQRFYVDFTDVAPTP